jgi:hypothetical protein
VRLIKYLNPIEPAKLVSSADSEVPSTSRSISSGRCECCLLPIENSSVPAARADDADRSMTEADPIHFMVSTNACGDVMCSIVMRIKKDEVKEDTLLEFRYAVSCQQVRPAAQYAVRVLTTHHCLAMAQHLLVKILQSA